MRGIVTGHMHPASGGATGRPEDDW
ncbi:hypothetical protein SPV1_05218 [Mariprofundus ferrooxydans PV-1]|uniref:Uncharacterized protein n=1 Tax=Mariprofundus ferrooxydans PV-1 TaxID=314345 RepID=Q0F2U7_9PROT|nr:hypothetical protein SPV1_05218 [Mariprofundus ferrooxydans PV-1]